MSYLLVRIAPDGSRSETRMDKAPDLATLQKEVGGYIEPLGYFTKLQHNGATLTRGRAFADEDGISKRLPFNPNGTAAWRSVYPQAGELVGPVVFYAKEKR